MGGDAFKILQWSGDFDGAWADGGLERYRREGFDGLDLTPGGAWAPANLGFLEELEGLRFLEVRGKVADDLAAFRHVELEELTLATGSRRRVPEVVRPRLKALCVTDRPGVEVAQRWPNLERIRIGGWRGADLGQVAGAQRLNRVYLEAKRQRGTLRGLETCTALTELISINYAVEDTAPLSGLHNLREVRLMAASPTPSHSRVSFADLAGPELTKIWISNARNLLDFDALRSLPRLRELRLIGCALRGSDAELLKSLPASRDVRIIDPVE